MKRRIAYICGAPSYHLKAASGYATHIRELTKAFEGLGHQVDVLMPSTLSPKKQVSMGMRHHPLKKWIPSLIWEVLKDIQRLKQDRKFASQLQEHLAANSYDVLYERMDISGSILARLKGISVGSYVLEIHAPLQLESTYFDRARPLQKCFWNWIQKGLQGARGVVVVSGVVKSWVEENGMPAENVLVVPNAVNLETFTADAAKKNSPYVKTKGTLAIGFVGSALRWFGLDMLVRVFSELVSQYSCELVIVGPSNENQELSKLVMDLKIERSVKFLGSISYDFVPSVIHQFDICVMPSSNPYGSPIKIFEYGAMGKPVIAPDLAPIREVVEHGVSAFLIPNKDPIKLKEALQSLLENPKLRNSLGCALQDKVRSQYGWQHAASRIANRFFP